MIVFTRTEEAQGKLWMITGDCPMHEGDLPHVRMERGVCREVMPDGTVIQAGSCKLSTLTRTIDSHGCAVIQCNYWRAMS